MRTIDIETLDRRIKWCLLLVSIATLVVLSIAALRDNIFTQWHSARKEYAKLLRAKATDERGRKIAEQFEIRVVQNVLPGLGTVDRCVTCHSGISDPRMANEKQPHRTHPGDYLQNHPPEKFGCTVCHRGQGRALVFAEAKAEGYHWDYPLLPREHLTAECGRCHTQLSFANEAVVREGERLFSNAGCIDCHRVGKLGVKNSSDLSAKGLRLLGRKWWSGHPDYSPDPQTRRPALAELRGEDRDVLQQFLLAWTGASQLAHGQQLYKWYGCGGCHKIGGVGGNLGPELTNEGRKLNEQFSFAGIQGKHDTANWLYEHFLDPQRVTPGSKMPRFEMSREEATALTTYMLSLRAEPELPQGYIPRDARLAVRTHPQGEELLLRYCSACHGKNGEGTARTSFGRSAPGILNPAYLRIAQPEYIRLVANHGRPDRDMPNWRESLDRADLETVLSYIESRRSQPLPYDHVARTPGDALRGAKAFAQNCAVCHGDGGAGGIGPKLKTATFLRLADNRFLYQTIVKGRPNTPMPAWADLSANNLADLLALFSRWREQTGARPTARPPIPSGQSFRGVEIYSASCAKCHGDKGQGGWAVALQNPVLLESASPEYLAYSVDRCREWAASAHTSTPHPAAPPTLTAKHLGEVVAFLQSWRYVPRLVNASEYRPAWQRGDAAKGLGLFNRKCMGCHGSSGVDGVAPAIGSPRLLNAVPDGYLIAAIAVGRSNTIMLARGLNAPGNTTPLSAKEILDIVAYLRSLQPAAGLPSPNKTAQEK